MDSLNLTRRHAFDRVEISRVGSLSSPSTEYLQELSAQLRVWLRDVEMVLSTHRFSTQNVLTPREFDLITALDSERTYEEIAAHLKISVNTVRHHIRNLYVKLGVKTRHSAVIRYAEMLRTQREAAEKEGVDGDA